MLYIDDRHNLEFHFNLIEVDFKLSGNITMTLARSCGLGGSEVTRMSLKSLNSVEPRPGQLPPITDVTEDVGGQQT